ncbi:hypothetical protein LEP1GSC194_4164 [Leptospira alstonii serovar Sichuan str. 79601]|uniref:Uncharacterized protein n=1 Tax=Leptospira alstonii serovar Sichuan str. 79601 TaxID=1218565 RepID=M6CJ29_9LEPT|nr:hypothetical protein LEP1GSC194_4164 [Leptospira alstonii serovar Sichuan str. 79601]
MTMDGIHPGVFAANTSGGITGSDYENVLTFPFVRNTFKIVGMYKLTSVSKKPEV